MMRRITIFLVLLLSLGQLFAQDRTITGKVTDENSAPLLGATVAVKGTTKGTLTDIDGNYKLSVGPDAVLVFSYVGYITQEIAVGTTDVIDLTLKPDVQNLEQVVVIGYGVQKKSLVTGSISKIDSKDITSAPAARIDQALQGKTSGVYIAQSSGTPGGAMSIKIRGNSSDGKNDPIYIVNGVKTGSIDFLAPSDIESVEILKDAASSAIYGAEGGNGVVIITTKKGKRGISEVNYNFYYGSQSAANYVQPMTTAEYAQYNKEAISYEKKPTDPDYNSSIAKYDAMAKSGVYTNWMDEIFQTAPVVEHNLSFMSGTETSSFQLSASYYDQDGIIGGDKSNFNRMTFNLSGESDIKSWLTVGTNVNYAKSKKNNLNESAEGARGIINSAIYYDPTVPVYYNDISELPAGQADDEEIFSSLVRNKDGKIYYNSLETTLDASNPLGLIEITNNKTTVDKILGDVHADVKFFDGLKFTTKLAVDYSMVIDDVFKPKNYFDVLTSQTKDSAVSVENTYTKYYKYAFENYLSFSKSFGEHSIDLLGGISYENYKPTFIYALGNSIPYGSKDFAYLRNGKYPSVDGGIGTRYDYDRSELQNSYFGRFVYNYKERYMLQGNFRYDGSSLFGPNNKYALFPSFSVGWNISKEDFFKDNIAFINTLKVRLSWGQNGNKQILRPFGYVTNMKPVTAYVDATGNYRYGAIPERPGNNNLKWETSQQTDFGIEAGLFKNRITLSIDRFVKTTVDQLSEMATAADNFGYAAKPYENNGEVQNKGWEFDLGYRESESEFKYSVTVNASYLNNEVTKYGTEFNANGYKMNIGDVVTRYEVGYPVWYFRGFKAIGIFQDQDEINNYVGPDGKLIQPKATVGDVKYADIAGKDADGKRVMVPDGKIDENDKTMIGKPQPDWTFGMSLSAEFKGIDFSVSFQGVTGNQIFFSALQTSHPEYNKPNYYYTERWTPENHSNTYPKATRVNTENFKISTLNVFDGDYLRMKNITLGYTLPKTLTSKVGIGKLRVYVSGTNLLTFTNYKGTDPEIGQLDISQNNSFGIDRGLYPQPKVYSFGANLSF